MSARLRASWRSGVYGLYQQKVTIGYEGEHKFHQFTCANKKCKSGKHGKPGTVRRYLDSKDRAATGNLITHAKTCRGDEAVNNCLKNTGDKKKGARDGSIYAAFARLGDRVRSFSHRPHTSQETRANIVRWITESNRPAKIVTDPGFECLMKTGRPSTSLPSPRQVSRDSHTGEALAMAFQEVLDDYGIQKKVRFGKRYVLLS
ncbi:hypothetical protein B0H12DRAFT_1204084 [Mycena haematopus]|nr:hypothetical protein B0H12DRAFT_1204084 [Mycena haematopus]